MDFRYRTNIIPQERKKLMIGKLVKGSEFQCEKVFLRRFPDENGDNGFVLQSGCVIDQFISLDCWVPFESMRKEKLESLLFPFLHVYKKGSQPAFLLKPETNYFLHEKARKFSVKLRIQKFQEMFLFD